MILHGERKWIIAQPDLLDDIVGRAPGFDFATVRQPIDRLMVRTVYLREAVPSGTVVAQRLDIVIFLLG